MAAIDPRAVVDPAARSAKTSAIGPFCVVGPDVVLGDGRRSSFACRRRRRHGDRRGNGDFSLRLDRPSSAGLEVPGRSLDACHRRRLHDPRRRDDQSRHAGGRSCGPSSGTAARSWRRRMSAHDCRLGNDVVLSNNVMLAGHVAIGDGADPRRRRRRAPVRADRRDGFCRRLVRPRGRSRSVRDGDRRSCTSRRAQSRRLAAARSVRAASIARTVGGDRDSVSPRVTLADRIERRSQRVSLTSPMSAMLIAFVRRARPSAALSPDAAIDAGGESVGHESLSRRRRTVGRLSRREADRRIARARSRISQCRRRRRRGDGARRARQPVSDDRTCGHGVRRGAGATAEPAARSRDGAGGGRLRARRRRHHRQSRLHASRRQENPRAWRQKFRSSITSARRVWAWRPGRARAMRAYIDRVLALLPFEPSAYVRLEGPPCEFVGHPLVEHLDEMRPNAEEAAAREADVPTFLLCRVRGGPRSGG